MTIRLLAFGVLCSLVPVSIHAKEPVSAPRPVVPREAKSKESQERMVVRNQLNRPIPVHVNADDPTERFLLLVPAGPMIVELTMTIDEKPFRQQREALIDRLLKLADKNEDGTPTWEEAFASPRFTMNSVRTVNEQQKQRYLQQLDLNENGVVERVEVRNFLISYFQGDTFLLTGRPLSFYGASGGIVRSNGRTGNTIGGTAQLLNVLDTDKDGVLSSDEIAAAGDRLKSRDADDNDLLYQSELMPRTTQRTQPNPTRDRPLNAPRLQSVFPLGDALQVEAVFQMLKETYGGNEKVLKPEHFRHLRTLGDVLDADEDGSITIAELKQLNTLPPQLHLSLDLSPAGKGTGFKVQSVQTPVNVKSESRESVTLTLPGVSLKFNANLRAAQVYNYAQTTKSYMLRYDKDTNGYLDEKELTGQFSQFLTRWDLDGDGLVYPKEITESFTLRQAPLATQIRTTVTQQGNPLFQSLDQTGDQRLSLREMKAATQNLLRFDKNNDGKISGVEVPASISLMFGLGNTPIPYQYIQGRNPYTQQTGSTSNTGPKWFTHMDRNGDGDITLKEWPGTREAFEEIDTNNDGFVEAKEAAAVGS